MPSDRPADQIRKLVTLAASGDTPETAVAKTKAREAIAKLDVELLSTLAGQRDRLVEEIREERHRLISSHERATKGDTGELMNSAHTLLMHYQRLDALIAAVLLLRIEEGHQLTNEERQQLDGKPKDDFFDRWMRAGREQSKADREKRRAKAKRRAREQKERSAR